MPALNLQTIQLAMKPLPKKAKAKPAPFVYRPPTQCAYGAMLLKSVAEAWAAPLGTETYVPPVLTDRPEHPYKWPWSPCGNTLSPATNQGCQSCRAHAIRFQSTMNTTASYSDFFKAEERAIGRRFTYTEAVAIFNVIDMKDISWVTGLFSTVDEEQYVDTAPEDMPKGLNAVVGERRFLPGKLLDYVMNDVIAAAKRQYEYTLTTRKSQEEIARDMERQHRIQETAKARKNIAARLALATEMAATKNVAISPVFTAEPSDVGPCTTPRPEVRATFYESNIRYYRDCGHRTSRCTCYTDRQTDKSPDHGKPFLITKGPGVRRLVGIELEFNEYQDMTPWVRKWRGQIHSDGSCGHEAVTTPIAGTHIDACMRDLCKSLREAGTGADERCGIHVHVDATDIRWPDMMRLLRVYALIEPLLYLMGGQQRINGTYCKPTGTQYAQALESADFATRKKAVLTAAYEDLGRERSPIEGHLYARMTPGKKDSARYKGLNIVPWLVGRKVQAPDTTIEFRIHRNSLDAKRVAGWAHLMAAIVDYANRSTDAEVAVLPKSALRALCQHVAPGSKAFILKRVAEWRSVTTAERGKKSDAAGNRIPPRRMGFVKGQWAIKGAV